MLHLVFLLGCATLAATTIIRGTVAWNSADVGEPLIIIEDDKTLMWIAYPPIDFDLSDLDIHSLTINAFAGCASVRSLNLSKNWISELPPGIFSNMTNLEHLSLAWNELESETMVGAFRNLVNLKSLDLTHNPLSRTLKSGMFVGLPHSCEIHIGKAKNLRTITPRVFGRIEKFEPKNYRSANESKNCPDSLDDRIEMFEVERSWIRFGNDYEDRRKLNDEPYSDDGVKMCTDGATVRFVDFSNVTETASPNCRTILINLNGTKLKIYDDSITTFESRWFRIRNTSVNAIYLYPKSFENLTRDLLSDLPENIRFFSLQESDLEQVKKGLMINEHLRGLDLSVNLISFIEKDAFAGLNLTRLNLGFNPIVTLDYVPNLPETLLWLNLDFTGIHEIPGNSFSHLKNLLSLSLCGSKITELQPPDLDGLVSLQRLDLSSGQVKNLRPGVFRDLSRLHIIDLSENQITLEKGVFNGLVCLAKLDLRRNRLPRLGRGMFDGFTDSLEVMDLSQCSVEVVEADAFVGVPKYKLSLMENDIRKIEKDAFDLPYLRYLDLRRNNLTTIEKGAAKSLGNLADKTEIRLGFNPIERLEDGALAGVSSKARVNLAATYIKVIQAGVFDDS